MLFFLNKMMKTKVIICLVLLSGIFSSCKKDASKDSLINIIERDKSLVATTEGDYRPLYHFTPKQNWMNDPNGLVYYGGKFHLFYQHNPFGNTWGPMHWGHTVSTDLFNWEDKPIAISPDNNGTIFSGSIVVDANNTSGFKQGIESPLVAVYTLAGAQQSQSIAFSNNVGESFVKYDQNPVLPNSGEPDFRDPKVFWHAETQKWIMSLAVRNKISFYSSSNLKNWVLESSFGETLGAHGGVWECPDLFKLKVGGTDTYKWVLLVSLNPGGPNGGSGTQYFVGDFDGKTFKTASDKTSWVDYGTDNYAGVTFDNEPNQKRIFIGWMSNWNYADRVPTTTWRSTMTVPRELKLQTENNEYYLTSSPVNELQQYLGTASGAPISGPAKSINLINNNTIRSGSYQISFSIDLSKTSRTQIVLGNSIEKLVLVIDLGLNQMVLDRSLSGKTEFNNSFKNTIISAFRPSKSNTVDFKILVDKTSLELFTSGGKDIITALFFPSYQYSDLKMTGEAEVRNLEIKPISKSLRR
jgi:fructan beta-fructosidase